ncbi:MAG: hypothetical protein H0V23_09190 [Nocardioidaceae bacterium]|nr:hypothetical protein [Nocardioidaceae bacterium]
MFELAVDLLHEVRACDGGCADTPGTGSLPSAALTPAQLIDRIAAIEKLVHALQAEQARDMAAFADARIAADKELGAPDSMQGRTISTELGLALGVAPLTAGVRVTTAITAMDHHPKLLALLGTGRVSMSGLRLAIKASDVLDPHQRNTVDAQLAEDVVADRLTPGMLERAATRRVLAVDPDAAVKRAAAARQDRRVSVIYNPLEGTGVLFARLRAEEALAVHSSLDARARGMRADGDERSLTNLMCDLLIEDVTGRPMRRVDGAAVPPDPVMVGTEPPDPDPDPWDPGVPDPFPPSWQAPCGSVDGSSPPSPRRLLMKVEVQVVMSAAALLGLEDAPALLRGYGAIPVDVAARSPTPPRRQRCGDCSATRSTAGWWPWTPRPAPTSARCASSASSATNAAGLLVAGSSTSTTSTRSKMVARPVLATAKGWPRTRM